MRVKSQIENMEMGFGQKNNLKFTSTPVPVLKACIDNQKLSQLTGSSILT